MTDVKVKHGHGILAPGDETFAFETATGILDPHLFTESTGDIGLRGTGCRTRTRSTRHLFLQRRDHHKPQHGREEYGGVQQETQRCGRTHGIRNLEESTKDRLRELVGLGVRDDEEHQRRYERILGLQGDVHLLWLRDFSG